ncbi:hypothetical protein Tco_1098977, partial [Tanacetum coccineum]
YTTTTVLGLLQEADMRIASILSAKRTNTRAE